MASLPPSLHQRINYYNTDRCVASPVREKTCKTRDDSGVLCVCVGARWKMFLFDVSVGRHVSRVRGPAPPRSLHSNTPGWSLWCAPCWEHKQSRGRKAVRDTSLTLRSQIIIPLIIFIRIKTLWLAQYSSQQRNVHANDLFNLVTSPQIVLLHLKQDQNEPMQWPNLADF